MFSKYFKRRTSLIIFALILGQLVLPFPLSNVKAAPSLFVEISANPSSGNAPLNGVDLTAAVSGTATGNITYKFDCTSNGSWERVITTSVSTYTAADLCNYSNSGTYTATVRVERANLTYQGTTAIFAQSSSTLFVEISANPSSGNAPLNGVDLTATISGTATGNITYKFDCTSNGSWERTITTSASTYTAADLCNYSNPGTYTAKVRAERGGLTAENTSQISVQEISTFQVSVSASPSSGYAPLEDVDITATISGTATGNITYKFDCTGDGYWERTETTNSTSYTAYDLCDYYNPGIYTIKVSVERGGLLIQGNTNVVVGEFASLAVDFSAYPSSGTAPLYDVDLTVYVSGTATGNITYKFDCTGDGYWERTETTNSTSYTAYDLCDYYNPGVYTAKARVERGGGSVDGITTIVVSSP